HLVGWPRTPIAQPLISGTVNHPMRASISIGLACNGATPIAIASATRPSIFAVDLRLLGAVACIVQGNHGMAHAHRKHRVTAVREVTFQNDLLQISKSRAHARNALTEFNEALLD